MHCTVPFMTRTSESLSLVVHLNSTKVRGGCSFFFYCIDNIQ